LNNPEYVAVNTTSVATVSEGDSGNQGSATIQRPFFEQPSSSPLYDSNPQQRSNEHHRSGGQHTTPEINQTTDHLPRSNRPQGGIIAVGAEHEEESSGSGSWLFWLPGLIGAIVVGYLIWLKITGKN
jgi:hypothetical protein